MPKLTQKQVISAVKDLKSIKPNQEWVSLLKSQILTEKAFVRTIPATPVRKVSIFDVLASVMFQRKFAYALAAFVFVITGMFGFAQYTVPGDLLFPVKKISEMKTSPLAIAVMRSDDALKVAKSNKDVYPAIGELKASLADAAKNLVATITADKDSLKTISEEIKKIEENKRQLQTLGIDIGSTQETKELDNALAPLVKSELTDLGETTLTDEQKESLTKAQELYDQGKYSDALEVILTISN